MCTVFVYAAGHLNVNKVTLLFTVYSLAISTTGQVAVKKLSWFQSCQWVGLISVYTHVGYVILSKYSFLYLTEASGRTYD